MRIVLVDSGDYARDRREEMVELRKQRVSSHAIHVTSMKPRF